LDMTELFGVSVTRKDHLYIIPTMCRQTTTWWFTLLNNAVTVVYYI
jgi:hypothetical protein